MGLYHGCNVFNLYVQLLWITFQSIVNRYMSNSRQTAWRTDRTENRKVTIAYFSKWSHEGEHLAGAVINVAYPNMQFQTSGTPKHSNIAMTCDAATVISVGRFDPLYAKSRKIMRATRARSILTKEKKKGEPTVGIFRIRKSIPSRYTRAPVRADSSVASATLQHWTTVGGRHRSSPGEITCGDRRSNEDECLPEWVDREIARR